MKFSEMQAAVAEAKADIERTDRVVGEMADIVSGRLRKGNVGGYTLRLLKEELRSYNIHTRSWHD